MHNIETTTEGQVEFFPNEKTDEAPPQPPLQPYWIETALDWWERSRASTRIVPTDPVTAAQAFLRGDISSGIGFLDEALLATSGTTKHSCRREAPIVELLEMAATTKTATPGTVSCSCSGAATWTLISLAARFVVATRPSKFVAPLLLTEPQSQSLLSTSTTTTNATFSTQTSIHKLPKVILIDPFHSISIKDLVSAVRGTWLLQEEQLMDDDTGEPNVSNVETLAEAVVEECLSRIHFLFPSPDTMSTVAVLEALQCQLSSGDSNENSGSDDKGNNNNTGRGRDSQNNDLLLWDSFLSTIPDKNGKQEVIRQLMRLWRDTNLMMVVASTRGYSELDDSCVTCRIRLEQATIASAAAGEEDDDDDRHHEPHRQHSHKATLLGSKLQHVVPFTIGTAGILS